MAGEMHTNPRAFPFAAEYRHPGACGGMTLRDWFAGQALAGGLIPHYGYPLQVEGVVEGAFDIADAMLAARATPASLSAEGER